ncbi:MAG: hypothetical protein J7599_19420 [Niabella sp.]|nr:hypothetical protein [Niabella sp.]
MNRLTSKVQYQDFEKGEFTRIAERDFQETMALILAYPWTSQRAHFVVGLTGPGVMVQDNRGNYLKLALYYHNKYVAYYCDAAGQLYQKTFEKPEDFNGVLTSFFMSSDTAPAGLRLQKNFLRNTKQHFPTRNFRYSVRDLSFWQLISRGGTPFYILTGIFFIAMIAPRIHHNNRPGALLFLSILFLIIFLMGGGLNLLLLCRYYFADKNTVIILSKGLQDFYFGNEQQQVRYNKQDVLKIELKRRSNRRSPVSDFAVYKICMKDGTELRFTSLLIPPDALIEKMHRVSVRAVERFAWPAFRAL